jgi:hypothetical protein
MRPCRIYSSNSHVTIRITDANLCLDVVVLKATAYYYRATATDKDTFLFPSIVQLMVFLRFPISLLTKS